MFVARLTDSEGEARETQTWLLYAWKCSYINAEQFINLNNQYNQIIGMLVNMMSQSQSWCTFSSINKEQK
ncbi:four helix bundle protein [Chryseobacterium sp. JK1]|uniref:four helix bundle protein n=1 Tax=Chryseobacterium sp. JK1 TaxID=874294 RepID=UPI003D68DFAB